MNESSYDNYLKVLNRLGLTNYRVSKDTGVSQSVFSKWKSGFGVPGTSSLQKIAEYLGVSVDYLLGNEAEDGDSAPVSSTRKFVLDQVNSATDKELKDISKYIAAPPEKRKQIDKILKILDQEEQLN